MATRPIAIGGNWKLHLTLAEAKALATAVRAQVGDTPAAQVLLFPPYPFLAAVAEALAGSALQAGAQDLFAEDKGAFTGGVSAPMIASTGATAVLVGHSERRTVFGESDAVIAAKLRAALRGGLRPVLCVGESLAEREADQTIAVVDRQLTSALQGLQAADVANLVLAYEPVWAIGTGRVATPEQAQDVHRAIRARLAALLGADFASRCPIQYGGSVKAATAAGLLAQPDIDGLLVGGASLQADEFAAIVRARVSD
jgi:triosephosphate isomerase